MNFTYWHARVSAGRCAMKTVSDYGIERATEICKGYAAAFVLTLSAMIGVKDARAFVDELLPPSVIPHSKPYLAWDRGSEMQSRDGGEAA